MSADSDVSVAGGLGLRGNTFSVEQLLTASAVDEFDVMLFDGLQALAGTWRWLSAINVRDLLAEANLLTLDLARELNRLDEEEHDLLLALARQLRARGGYLRPPNERFAWGAACCNAVSWIASSVTDWATIEAPRRAVAMTAWRSSAADIAQLASKVRSHFWARSAFVASVLARVGEVRPTLLPQVRNAARDAFYQVSISASARLEELPEADRILSGYSAFLSRHMAAIGLSY